MSAFKYNPESQKKYSPGQTDSFIKDVPREKRFTPKEGANRIRILPPWSREGAYAKRMLIHWQVGLSRSSFLCPELYADGSCPFCRAHKLMKGDYDKFKADIEVIRVSKRWYSNVISYGSPNAGVLLYSYGKTVAGMLEVVQNGGQYGDITDPVAGSDLTLERSGSGRQVNDVVFPDRNSTKLQNPVWLDQLHDLDNIWVSPDPVAVDNAFKSQPWKIWSGETRSVAKVAAPTPVPAKEEVKTEPEKTPDLVNNEPPLESPSAVDMEAKLKELEEKLNDKMNKE